MLMVMAMLRLEAARHAGLQLLLIQVLIAMTAVLLAFRGLQRQHHLLMGKTRIVMVLLITKLAFQQLKYVLAKVDVVQTSGRVSRPAGHVMSIVAILAPILTTIQ